MRAVNAAEIRPEVSGRIVEVKIKDRQSMKSGDVMFVIGPRRYQAAVAKGGGEPCVCRHQFRLR